MEFSGATVSGTASFSLESLNQKPITISAELSDSDLTDFAQKINEVANQTGVRAHLSDDKLRVVIESETGKDIIVPIFLLRGRSIVRLLMSEQTPYRGNHTRRWTK